ncbi:2-isopropylmalate synthase [candidate division KSB1 bacterium]|nr:2-isopropylmalate synthase [candidate division KSB1 bacterium]
MVSIFDATLREGEQTPGVYFPEHVKLEIANQLDKLGVAYIEAGHPLISNEIYTAVKHIAAQPLKSLVGAHSRSLQQDVDAALECGVKFLGIFYCVSDERLKHVFKTDLNGAVKQITDVIAYAKKMNPKLLIRFTPEDTVRSDFYNVVNVATEAVNAGADIISIADTTGFMIPHTEHNMYDYVKRLKDSLASKNVYPKIAVHCHNDLGLAVANAFEGFRAGAEIIDASVLGLGERAGIVDLATLLGILTQGFNGEHRWNLEQLIPLYKIVSHYADVPIPVNSPVVGKNAFKHCAGVHTHAAQLNPLHYQSIDPRPFGRIMEISLDHMSGISSIKCSLEKIGEAELDQELVKEVLVKVKEVGQSGRTVSLEELAMIANWVKKLNEEIKNVS